MRLFLLLSCFFGGLLALGSAADNSTTCSSAELRCANGRCINLAWKCDGEDDCHDNTDENNCPSKTCAEDFFRCNNGVCIPLRWSCDGSSDCEDDGDEAPSLCSKEKCNAGFFQCKADYSCIPEDWRCDHQENCPDGEDEKDCYEECTDDEFKCGDGKCIDKAWKCNGDSDCDDGSDEKDCDPTQCDEEEKMCADGTCFHSDWFCDGDYDCADNSDELNCNVTQDLSADDECQSNSFRCLVPGSGPTCVNKGWVCDGDPDCNDESDEADCSGMTCQDGKRSCLTGYCIKEEYFCDGEEDCVDGSDEKNCNFTCAADQFDCKNNKCISDSLVCNGVDDCGNSQDEAPERNCPSTVNNSCLKNNGGCSDLCVVDSSNAKGRRCECKAGFKLMKGSETACEDIDECLNPSTCSQACRNTKGSYKCECAEGYQLVDGRFCKALTHHNAELILTDLHELRRYHLSTDHYSLLLGDDNMAGGRAMDLDVRNKKVYWADNHKPGTIYVGDIESQKRDVVLDTGLKDAEGLALDWVHGNLYISDKSNNIIQVLRVADKSRKTLVTGLTEPMGLATDPYLGWIYWTHWSETPGIQRCGMNGASKQSIVSQNVAWPYGLTIDYFNRRLYWVDAKLHTISSSRLDGSDQRLVMKGHARLPHPFGITIFEDYLYWTDLVTNSVLKSTKFGTDNVTTVAHGLRSPMGIQILHLSRQPYRENRCEHNGGCSHLCLPVPVADSTVSRELWRAECACPDGMILDGKFVCISADAPVPNPPSGVTEPAKIDTKETTEKPKGGVTVDVVVPGETTEDESPNVPYRGVTEPAGKGVGAEQKGGKSEGHIAIIASCVVGAIGLVAAVIIILLVRRYKKRNVKSMNFDNPVYRKTTTDDQLIMDSSHSSLPQSMQPLNDEPEIV